MEDSGGAPLWETLEASFPSGLFPDGLEYVIKGKIRKRLRDFGYRVTFPAGDPWQVVIESFAIGGLERIHRGFGDNPWFWVVAWPSVFGAASSDFWPDVGSAAERRSVAYAAAAAHLEAILIRHALGDADAVGMLPASAARGLRAIGQSSLPALPGINLDKLCLPEPRGYRRGRARNSHILPALKDGGDAWANWKTGQDAPAAHEQGGGRGRKPAEGDAADQDAEGECGDGGARRHRSKSASRRGRGRQQGGLRGGVLYLAHAARAIGPFPDGDARGYLAPVEVGEALEVLFVGEPETEDAPWAYARRAREPADASWPGMGWLLLEVVPPAAPSRRSECDPGFNGLGVVEDGEQVGQQEDGGEAEAGAPASISPGDVAFYVHAGGLRSALRPDCPGSVAGSEAAAATAPHDGDGALPWVSSGERVQVTALSGHWAKVTTDRRASGWVESRHIALERPSVDAEEASIGA